MSNSIYIITNTVTDKVYIGQTSRSFEIRKSEHIRYYETLDYHIYRAMRKYGIDKFSIDPICSVPNVDNLNELEIQFIKEYDSFHNGYNMTLGGNEEKMSQTIRDKISKSKTGTKRSKHSCLKQSKTITGVKRPDLMGNNIKRSGCLNYQFKGYYHTPFGKLTSANDIINLTHLLSCGSIKRWCKNSDKIIYSRSITGSQYLQSLDESPLGKTFKEIGFWFDPLH